jgi:DNA-binding transcriptional ArsR family regulator
LNEVDWSSLHKILSDTTRRSILELLAEKGSLGYTEILTLLHVTNTGRLNYHLKALGDLISKDGEGKYRLTERGQLAVNLLKAFPERVPTEARRLPVLKIAVCVLLVVMAVIFLTIPLMSGNLGQHVVTSSASGVTIAGPQAIPQNTTVSLTDWFIPKSAPMLNITWAATGPVKIYVLNATQYGDLVLQDRAPSVQDYEGQSFNFTGAPGAWVSQYYLQAGNVSLKLANGTYYVFAGSGAQRVVLDTFNIPDYTETVSGISPYAITTVVVDWALAALFIILAWSIARRRVWR